MAAYISGSAAPVRRAAPEKQVRRQTAPKVVKKNNSAKRAEKLANRKKAFKILAVAAICFTLLTLSIIGHVKVNELGHELSLINKEISILDSENTRLNMQLTSNVNLGKVEDFAVNELGMVKVQDYQVNYVASKESDSVEVSGKKGKKPVMEKESPSKKLSYLKINS